jgi:PKD repeat protein
VTDSNGGVTSAATIVFVQAQAPIVSLTFNKTVNGLNTDVVFTATVTPASTLVAQYVWTFGDGTSTTTTTNTVSHQYLTTTLPKTASVTVTTTSAQTGTNSTTVF